MARSEKYSHQEGEHLPDAQVSHSRTCGLCGQSGRWRRVLRSKPRRAEAKADIKERLQDLQEGP